MDTRADRLARAVRDHPLVIEERTDHRCVAGAHSYLADGRVVCWVLPARPSTDEPAQAHAVDAELATQPVPPRLRARWSEALEGGTDRFWALWCATEVLAKLADEPMVMLVHRAPVTASPVSRGGVEVHWLVRRVDDVVVAHGLSWATVVDRSRAT
ncbi:hypothetical protein [Terrabacter sp. 2RAF25]|uniref:hypothetical protein n=1 Tax=Terrabacter sp. 2RAF25 TaxID=3232998 RepID=UPI003F95330C